MQYHQTVNHDTARVVNADYAIMKKYGQLLITVIPSNVRNDRQVREISRNYIPFNILSPAVR